MLLCLPPHPVCKSTLLPRDKPLLSAYLPQELTCSSSPQPPFRVPLVLLQDKTSGLSPLLSAPTSIWSPCCLFTLALLSAPPPFLRKETPSRGPRQMVTLGNSMGSSQHTLSTSAPAGPALHAPGTPGSSFFHAHGPRDLGRESSIRCLEKQPHELRRPGSKAGQFQTPSTNSVNTEARRSLSPSTKVWGSRPASQPLLINPRSTCVLGLRTDVHIRFSNPPGRLLIKSTESEI